mmetsp:Transcript_1290/g.1593  ORF Transcript_1290/g.1593 Transcript_1290/m.1593 type:complete len:89 (-) Transcript_1290:3648-3914(-)
MRNRRESFATSSKAKIQQMDMSFAPTKLLPKNMGGTDTPKKGATSNKLEAVLDDEEGETLPDKKDPSTSPPSSPDPKTMQSEASPKHD